MTMFNKNLKRNLWKHFRTQENPIDSYWEYLITLDMLKLEPGDNFLDIGGVVRKRFQSFL